MIIGAGGPSDRASIPLGTRRGTFIPNERRRELNPATLRASVDLWTRERPNARLRSVTAVYNCMGLVFASRRTCIDSTSLDTILREDEYQKGKAILIGERLPSFLYRYRSTLPQCKVLEG